MMLWLFHSAQALAQVNVNLPWTRVTSPGQKDAAVFLKLEAHVGGDVALIGASSPVASQVEIIAKRSVSRLVVSAGTGAELRPGASYLRLSGLSRPFRRGERIPVTLVFESAGRPPFSVDIYAEVLRANARHALSDHRH